MPTTTPDFNTLLETYRTNYADYKVTHNNASKVAYESALSSAQQYLEQTKAGIDQDAGYIAKFVTDYNSANPRLTELHRKSKNIRETVPKIESEYAVSKAVIPDTPHNGNPDLTPLYIKGGIAGALILLTLVVRNL